MEAADSIADEIKLFFQPSHALLNKRLKQLYEFAAKTSSHNKLCNSNFFNKNVQEAFRDTVATAAESADAILLVLTQSDARFQSRTKL